MQNNMRTIIKIPTWRCPECDYSQDFEPTQELMNIHFGGIMENHCPACFMGKNNTKERKICLMSKETNNDKKTTITIMGEDELETMEIETNEKDTEGKVKKRKLTNKEKEEKILKIRSDIEKFKLLEDK